MQDVEPFVHENVSSPVADEPSVANVTSVLRVHVVPFVVDVQLLS
jgi:predicted DNA-binding ribbon-helix-helix protein